MSNKLHSKEVNKKQWGYIVWTPIFLGLIILSVFSSTFFIPKEYMRASLYSSIGGILIGAGYGLGFARIFKIKGIDNHKEV